MKTIFKTRSGRKVPMVGKAPALPRISNTKVLLGEALGIMERYQRAKAQLDRLAEIAYQLRRADLSGTGYEVVDRFSGGKRTVFRPAAVTRFEIVAVKAPKKRGAP